MNDTLMTVGAIFLAAILMFIFPLMSTADRADDVTTQVVKTATQDFVDSVRTTGKITSDKYEGFVRSLASTGNTYDVNMEVKHLDESASKKTTTAASSKVGENYYYSEYNDQITGTLNEHNVYRLKQGDIVSVDVKNKNQTISQVLKNFMYRITGKDNYNITAQYSGLVNVNG